MEFQPTVGHEPTGAGAGRFPSDRRLRSLVDAGIALTSESSLEGILARLLELASELTGARYAAVGVLDPEGRAIERFIAHGVDPATEREIGRPPRGDGVLGALLDRPEPLRLTDLTADPRSVGFPPGHPRMTTFLGVPILLRGVPYGNLYLTEKAGGHEFGEEDEEVVMLLAAQAAVAIENVRLVNAATDWTARLESLNEILNALAGETELDALLELVARHLRDLLDARFVGVLLPAGTADLRFAAAVGEGSDGLVGVTVSRSDSRSGRAFETRQSARVDSLLDDPAVDHLVTRLIGARTGLWVPLLARGMAIGVLVAHDKQNSSGGRFGEEDLRLAETFASRAALAVDLSERVARAALRRVVTAQETERRLLARELHDETGQALASILLGLRSLERNLDGADSGEALAELRALAVDTLRSVRRLSVELHPKALDDFGLLAALERLIDTWRSQTGIEVDFAAHLGEMQIKGEPALVLFRVVQEALANIVKHAHAHRVSILLNRKNGGVGVMIEDDGRGFDPVVTSDGPGIQGMRERAQLLRGRLRIESAPGDGTTIAVEVPLD